MANEHVVGTGQAGAVVRTDQNAIRIKPEVDARIALIEPAEAPLDTLLRLVGRTSKISSEEFSVQEQYPLKNKTTLSATASASGTTLTLDDVSFLIPSMVGKILRTGEQIWLNNTAVITTTDGVVTNVVRGASDSGGSAAAALLVGDEVVFSGPALEEGQDKLQLEARMTGDHINYAQMTEHDIGISEQTALRGVFGPSERNLRNMQGTLEFRKRRNRMLLLNEPLKDTTSGVQALYITGGLRYWANQFNVANVGPGLTYDIMAQALSGLIRNGGSLGGRTVWGLTSQRVWNLVSGLPEIRGLARTTPDDDTIGFEVSRIKFPGGMGRLTIDHNMEDFGDEIIWFDLNHLEVAQFMPTIMRRNTQTLGSHREEWQLFSQEGLKVRLPLSTMRMHNIQYVA